MARRIIAGIVGVLALIACFAASVYAIMALLDDPRPPGVVALPWWAIVAELIMCSMALGTLIIGFRFLGFALTGRNYGTGGRWLRPILLGSGLFFPVFVVSVTLGLNWAYRLQPHGRQDESALLALRISFFLGVAAAVIGSGALLRKARSR